MNEKIYKVEKIEIKRNNNSSTLCIQCRGKIPTAGWTNPELVFKGNTSGIYEFDFCAQRPGGIVAQVISRINAVYCFETPPNDLTGIKINAIKNSLNYKLLKNKPYV